MKKLHRHLIAEVVAGLNAILLDGKSADTVVAQALHSHPKWGSRDRRLYANHVYEVVRHFRWACYLADSEQLDKVWAAWFMTREGEALPEEFAAGLDLSQILTRAAAPVATGIRESFPAWLDERCEATYGDSWPGLAAKLNQPAEIYLRVNRLRATTAEVAHRLLGEGIGTFPVLGAPDALQLAERKPLVNSPTWRAGWFEIQDAGSQSIAPFLEAAADQTVIDACAGAGGKTLHLAALMRNKGRLISLDVSSAKLTELETRCRRNGVLIHEPHVIGTETLTKLRLSADRVLLDVPCSGTGVIRRKADTKWHLNPSEIERLAALQQDILERYSEMVRPGGSLVYATCSLLPEENQQQVQRFLASHGQLWRLTAERWVRPDMEGWDGFYMARLQRCAEADTRNLVA